MISTENSGTSRRILQIGQAFLSTAIARVRRTYNSMPQQQKEPTTPKNWLMKYGNISILSFTIQYSIQSTKCSAITLSEKAHVKMYHETH